MKITKSQLKQIIKEELDNILEEEGLPIEEITAAEVEMEKEKNREKAREDARRMAVTQDIRKSNRELAKKTGARHAAADAEAIRQYRGEEPTRDEREADEEIRASKARTRQKAAEVEELKARKEADDLIKLIHQTSDKAGAEGFFAKIKNAFKKALSEAALETEGKTKN